MKTLDEIMSGEGDAMPSPGAAPHPEADGPDAASPPEATAGPQSPSPQPDGAAGAPAAPAPEPDGAARPAETTDLRQEFGEFRKEIQALVTLMQGRGSAPAPRPPAPSIHEDPDGFVRHAMEPLAQAQQVQREEFSRMMAVEKFGEGAVDAAYDALAARMRAAPAGHRWLYQRIMAAPHPYGELVRWHREHTALAEIGPDLAAFRDKVRAEVLAELQAQRQAATQSGPAAAAGPPAMPSNFAQSRSAGPRTGVTWTGPRPLSDIMTR